MRRAGALHSPLSGRAPSERIMVGGKVGVGQESATRVKWWQCQSSGKVEMQSHISFISVMERRCTRDHP